MKTLRSGLAAAAVLCFLGFAGAAKASDVHMGELKGASLQVAYGADDIAGSDISTITVVNSSGSAVLTLEKLSQRCEESCTDSGRACYFEASYAASTGPAAGQPASIVLMGARAVTNFHAIDMKRSTMTPVDMIHVWSSSAPGSGIRLEHKADGSLVNRKFQGNWDWDPAAGQGVFHSDRAPDFVLRGDRLQRCPVFASNNFASLGCFVDEGGTGVVSSWLYYKRELAVWYACEDCQVPHLRVSAVFQLEGEVHYILSDSRGTTWVLKRFGENFVVLEGPGDLLPVCAKP